MLLARQCCEDDRPRELVLRQDARRFEHRSRARSIVVGAGSIRSRVERVRDPAIDVAGDDYDVVRPLGPTLDRDHGGAQGARLVLAGREVNVWNGAPQQPGPMVLRYPGGAVTQQTDDGRIAYTVNNETEFGLRLTSDAFHGYKQDRWFFSRANFAQGSEQVPCLAARSY